MDGAARAAQLRLLRHNGRELRWMPTGALAVRRFESGFEEAHGPVHPVFYRGSLQQALGHSRREAKFLLVYLHAADHPNCETFAAAVLASQPFSAFVDENFVLWVADVAATDGLQARRATRVQELPAVIMLAHGDIAAPHAGGQSTSARGQKQRGRLAPSLCLF